MGMRFTTRLFKPPGRVDVSQAVLGAASKLGVFAREGEPKEDSSRVLLGVAKNRGVISADMPYVDGDFSFFQAFALELGGGPWIEVRVQEGSHWDYTLYLSLIHI